MPESEGPEDELVYVVTAAGVEARGSAAAFDSEQEAAQAELATSD